MRIPPKIPVNIPKSPAYKLNSEIIPTEIVIPSKLGKKF